MSPFKALYGQECLTPLRLANPNLTVPAAKETLEKMDLQLQIIRENLKKANDRQKSYASLKHFVQEFKGGDQVFIQVKPKKSSLRLGKHKKLAYRYCRPFMVTKRIGEQAYELHLPPHLHVHNVFHVILLKQYIADPSHALDHNDTILVLQEEFQMEPDQILKIKEQQLCHIFICEAFVLWKHLLAEDAS